jgi:hypothetical protein
MEKKIFVDASHKISVNELRIGNIVTIDNALFWPKLKNQPMIIVSITNCKEQPSLGLMSIDPKMNYFIPSYSQFLHFIKPVKITTEWLQKLNFIKDPETNYRWVCFNGFLAYDIDDNCIRIGDSWDFGKRYYVHQIQNLMFELTQKTKLITG